MSSYTNKSKFFYPGGSIGQTTNKCEEYITRDITTLVSSIITGVVAICVCIMNNIATAKKSDIEQDKRLMEYQSKMEQTIAIITCKLDELDRKQAIHNGIIERVYQLEKQTSVMAEKQSVANHRIDDLEKNKGGN